MITISVCPIWAQSLAGTSVLVEGTELGAGLPGFGANRIPALSGKYRAEDGTPVSVWAITEPLVFDSLEWKEISGPSGLVRFRQTAEHRQVWCVARSLSVRPGMEKYKTVVFMVSAAADVPESECSQFLEAFAARADFFFTSANRPADLSFPAVVILAGKNREG